MKVRIASRGSKLSRIQVQMVSEKLSNLGIDTEFIEIKTKADLFQNEPLHKLGKGVFEKEVNEAVLRGYADIAVHSMKDLTSNMDPNLEIFAVLRRDSPYDALVSRKNFWDLESGSIIGTSSIRRKSLVNFYREDLQVRDLRGNVDTRLRKYKEGLYDGIIIAEASILRLRENIRYFVLDPWDFTPEANQGIIVVVGRRKDSELKKIISEINHQDTFEEAIAERSAINVIGGGCHSPLGVLFRKEGEEFFGIINYVTPKKRIVVSITKKGSPADIGNLLGKMLLSELKNEGIVP